jgi:Na+-driven multidrug efflux pump
VLVRIIALFGTAQIAANGVANSIDYVGAIIVSAMSLAIVTVVGQCVGAGDYQQAKYYIRKLIKISYISSLLLDLLIIALCPLILQLYQLSDEASRIAFFLVLIHNVFIFTVYPLSGPLSSAMRAAGDVKYTMLVSIFATVVCRVVLSLVFGVWLNMGIIGIWLAMGLDWTIRAVLFVLRYRSGKWKEYRVI